jgi:hypothetical protein
MELHVQLRRWWAINREDLDIQHSMHFFLGCILLADDIFSPKECKAAAEHLLDRIVAARAAISAA